MTMDTGIGQDAGRVLGRGIGFPPRVDARGRVAWSEGEQNIREGMEIVLRTELRERMRLAAFGCGLNRYLFEPNTTTTRRQIQDQVSRALSAWEPRISLESVTVEALASEPEAAVITVGYQLVATRAAAEVTLTVRLGG